MSLSVFDQVTVILLRMSSKVTESQGGGRSGVPKND